MTTDRYRITSPVIAGSLEVNPQGVIIKAQPFTFQHLVGELLENASRRITKSGGTIEKLENPSGIK